MSRGISNSYLVTTTTRPADQHGHVLRSRGDSRAVRQGQCRPLRVIVITQGHADHVGGWSQFVTPGIETIVQANHADVREYWRNSSPFSRRTASSGAATSPMSTGPIRPPEPVPTTTFFDSHALHLGGRSLSCIRRREAKQPTHRLCGCPRTGWSSPATSSAPCSATSPISTRRAATSIRSAHHLSSLGRPGHPSQPGKIDHGSR